MVDKQSQGEGHKEKQAKVFKRLREVHKSKILVAGGEVPGVVPEIFCGRANLRQYGGCDEQGRGKEPVGDLKVS